MNLVSENIKDTHDDNYYKSENVSHIFVHGSSRERCV